MITLNNEQLKRLTKVLKVNSKNTLLAGSIKNENGRDVFFRYKNASGEELVGYYFFDTDEQDKVKYILAGK